MGLTASPAQGVTHSTHETTICWHSVQRSVTVAWTEMSARSRSRDRSSRSPTMCWMRPAPRITIWPACAFLGSGARSAREQLRSLADRIQRVANVVAHNRQNPLLEVACQCQLLLLVLLRSLRRFASLVHVDAAADEPGKPGALVAARNSPVEDSAEHSVVAPRPILLREWLAAVEMIDGAPSNGRSRRDGHPRPSRRRTPAASCGR
jgi:hypothetical protein